MATEHRTRTFNGWTPDLGGALGALESHVEGDRFLNTDVARFKVTIRLAAETGDIGEDGVVGLIDMVAEVHLPEGAKDGDLVEFRTLKVRILARIAELKKLQPAA